MPKPFFVILLFLLAFSLLGLAQTEVPYTLEDRDRLIRLEERVASVESQMQSFRNEMNYRFEAMESRFETMESRFETLDHRYNSIQEMMKIGITLMIFMLGAMVALFGFVLWDRRSAIRPLQFEVKNVEARNAQIVDALRKQALKDPSFAGILKETGILI